MCNEQKGYGTIVALIIMVIVNFVVMYLSVAVNNHVSMLLRATRVELNDKCDEVEELQKSLKITKQKLKEAENILTKIKRPITIRQGVNKDDLRYTITKVLEYLGEKNRSGFTELLMVTAQTESDLGATRSQRGGPALSVFQIEPNTEKCIWENYLKFNKKLANKTKSLLGESSPGLTQLRTNMEYAIAMAYFVYKRNNVNPSSRSIKDLAATHKKIFNTVKGKATVNGTLIKTVGAL